MHKELLIMTKLIFMKAQLIVLDRVGLGRVGLGWGG